MEEETMSSEDGKNTEAGRRRLHPLVRRLWKESHSHQTVYLDDRRRKALFAEAATVVAEQKRAGHLIAMRLLQSHLELDDEERAAIEVFLPPNG